MIVVDTNVISELWKPEPDAGVMAWMDAQAIETLHLSAMTVAELRYGIACMPEGRRRTFYQQGLEYEVLPAFAGRVLPFDLDTAKAYGELMSRARARGKAIATADGCIAATALTHGLMVATRDTRPFEAGGVETINPWTALP